MTIPEKFYTGVGSRETPAEYLAIMTELATYLNKTGWTLRSGGSWGADEAFQKVCLTIQISFTSLKLAKRRWYCRSLH